MFNSIWNNIVIIGKVLIRIYKEDHIYKASALTFTTLLSIIPLLSIVIFLLSIFPVFSTLKNNMQNFILMNLNPTDNEAIQSHLQEFIQQAINLPVMSIIFLAITAILLIITIENTINSIWLGEKKSRKSLVIHWLSLFILPVFVGLSLFLALFYSQPLGF